MAMTQQQLDKLIEEYRKISEENKKAYDALYSVSMENPNWMRGSESVGKRYEAAVAKNNKAAIENLKAKYDKLSAEYNRIQTKKNELKAQIDAGKKELSSEKSKTTTLKSAQSVYDKAMADLRVAEAGSMGYGGEQKYIDAYKKAVAATDTYVKAGGTPAEKPVLAPGIDPTKVKATTATGETAGETAGGKGMKQQDLINFLVAPENKQTLIKYQKALAANWGYKGNTTGAPDSGFIPALTKAYDTFSLLPTPWQGGKVEDFILKPTVSTGAAGGAGGGAGGVYTPTTTVYSKTSAKSLINSVFDALLKRKADPAELKDLTDQLIEAQKKNPSRQQLVNGVLQTTTGLNAEQFITDLVMAKPEYKTKEAAKAIPSLESVLTTAKNNGMMVSDSQKAAWEKRLKDGESPDTIASEIRSISSYGYPESVKKLMAAGTDLGTILSPYKNYMASVLELNPSTIDINDPALRMGIGPQSEMNLYDYQKALRKDSRWQYTKNAADTVNSAVDKVLQDFGFKG